MKCLDCLRDIEDCLCEEVNWFMNEHSDLMDDLAELEAKEKKGASRCLACCFYECRCARGLAAKLKEKRA